MGAVEIVAKIKSIKAAVSRLEKEEKREVPVFEKKLHIELNSATTSLSLSLRDGESGYMYAAAARRRGGTAARRQGASLPSHERQKLRPTDGEKCFFYFVEC